MSGMNAGTLAAKKQPIDSHVQTLPNSFWLLLQATESANSDAEHRNALLFLGILVVG